MGTQVNIPYFCILGCQCLYQTNLYLQECLTLLMTTRLLIHWQELKHYLSVEVFILQHR